MTITKLLAEAGAIIATIAHAPGVDHGTRARALSALSVQLDRQVRSLAQELEAANARALGLNPVSQVDGD